MLRLQRVTLTLKLHTLYSNSPKLASKTDGTLMAARGCRHVTALQTATGERWTAALALTASATGFLVQAPSGSSTWIWKAGCLAGGFSKKFFPKSSALEDEGCAHSCRTKQNRVQMKQAHKHKQESSWSSEHSGNTQMVLHKPVLHWNELLVSK